MRSDLEPFRPSLEAIRQMISLGSLDEVRVKVGRARPMGRGASACVMARIGLVRKCIWVG